MEPFSRAAGIAELATRRFDLLVVGGGITGAGIALDAAARGLAVAVVERDDWAAGTSSKSTKLVHGGLRYLQAREYRLVYESLAERQRLLRNAPHLVRPMPFLVPVFGKNGVANKAYAKAIGSALWVYEIAGAIRIGKRHRRVSRQQALAHIPTLDASRLVDAFLYYDAQADDARLTLTIARTAVLDYGAVACNHAAVTGFERDGADRICAAVLAGPGVDGLRVRTRAVVNAAGVWADEVRALDEGGHPHALRPAKGVHVTVAAERLPCDVAVVLSAKSDKRSLTVVPWGEFTYIGSTDTAYDGPLDDPGTTPADVDYLLAAVNDWLSVPLTAADVVGSWAGLRPLLATGAASARTADLSRRHAVTTSASGVVTVTGGKLTTYRRMAADAVDVVVRRLGTGPRRSPTARLRLRGAGSGEGHLFERYGVEAGGVQVLAGTVDGLDEPLVPGLPYLAAEAVYAVRHEMATTLVDVLTRRTRAHLLDAAATVAAAPAVAALIAGELGWSAGEAQEQVAAYRALAERERAAAGLAARG